MSSPGARFTCGDGHITVRLTPWDQRALGCVTAEFTSFHADSPAKACALLEKATVWASANRVTYFFGRVRSDARELRAALAANDYLMTECSLTLSREGFDHLPTIPRHLRVELRPAEPAELSNLQKIAKEDFHHGRFLEDPAIAHADAACRTANWLSDLLDKRLLKTALCDGRVIGFHSERVSANGEDADLILTGAAKRYAVLATPLWVSALEQLALQRVRRCSTLVSAANTGVINLYARLGFRYNSTLFGYRKFL